MQELESFLVLYQAEQPYEFFIYEKIKELIWPLVTWVMWTEVIQEHILAKVIKFDVNESSYFLLCYSSDLCFATDTAL